MNFRRALTVGAIAAGLGLGLAACGHSGPPATSFESGSYVVGEDITAGTYVARQPRTG